jgi:hypothetical protein
MFRAGDEISVHGLQGEVGAQSALLRVTITLATGKSMSSRQLMAARRLILVG